MEAIADALVYAVSYINCRPLEDHESRYDDANVGALARIIHCYHRDSRRPRISGEVTSGVSVAAPEGQ